MNAKLRSLLAGFLAIGFVALTGCRTPEGTTQTASAEMSATPCMAVLGRFTAADVPALGPAETEVTPGRWTNAPAPSDLPGNGLAQHPMLYIGEGYNKMFLVNDGKVIWTYSTGKGNEYDDVWMLSNGNILFTPDAIPRRNHAGEKSCVALRLPDQHGSPLLPAASALDKVLFIQNGLPPVLKVVNIKIRRGRSAA